MLSGYRASSAEGLNKEFYGKNVEYTVDTKDPMKINGFTTINAKEIYNKYYNHVSSNAMCVPQNLAEYFVHEWNRSANPDKTKYPDYLVRNRGCVRMDEKVHQFLINQTIGKPIAHYEYKPRSEFIKRGKEHYVPFTRRNYSVQSNQPRPQSLVIQFFKTNNKVIPGDIGFSADITGQTVINNINDYYCRTVESYRTYHPVKGGFGYEAQPQLHVELVATPQLKPGAKGLTYLNSACWKVECKVTIDFNITSAFSKGTSISWPLEANFCANFDRSYTDGQTLFGVTDDKNGAVTDFLEDEEDDDFTLLTNKTKKVGL